MNDRIVAAAVIGHKEERQLEKLYLIINTHPARGLIIESSSPPSLSAFDVRTLRTYMKKRKCLFSPRLRIRFFYGQLLTS